MTKILNTVSKLQSGKISYLLFNVTAKCNAFCDFCWNWQRVAEAGRYIENKPDNLSKRNELSLSEIEKISKHLPPLLLVNLCGGEPYLREDLVEIIDLLVKNNQVDYFSIPSNGFMTEKIISTVKSFCSKHPDVFFRLGISLDGPEDFHDKVRRYQGGYQKALETARQLQELKLQFKNFSVSCDLVFSAQNQDFLHDFIHQIYEKNLFDSIDVNLVRGELINNGIKNVDLQLYKKLNEDIIALRKKNNSHPLTFIQTALYEQTVNKVIEAKLSQTRTFSCYAGQRFITIDDCGDVHACEIMQSEDKKLGNLRDFSYDINELLKSKKALEVINFIEQKKCSCNWDCAINMSSLYDPMEYPELLWRSFKKALL